MESFAEQQQVFQESVASVGRVERVCCNLTRNSDSKRVAGVVTMRLSAAAPSSDSLRDQRRASRSCPGESRGRAAKITSLFSHPGVQIEVDPVGGDAAAPIANVRRRVCG